MRVRLFHCALPIPLLPLLAACHAKAPEYETVTAQEESIRIALPRISDGRAHFFTYHHKGRNVNFFLRTDGQGTLHAHFDACYSCFKYKRGYVQQGRQVVCIACRVGYDLDTPIWDYVGACVPLTLQCRTNSSEVFLRASAVQKGARFF